MTLRRLFLLLSALTVLFVAALPAGAQTLPASPGEFVIDIDLGGGPGPDATPTCDPDLTSIGVMLMSGQSSVSTTCTESSTATQKATTGTASNPTLATTTGDPGFNTGTVNALCDGSQSAQMGLAVSTSGARLNSLRGSAFYACSFIMAFQDAQQSSLVGTIEINAAIVKNDAVTEGSTVTIAIDGTVYVTAGTGAFEGAVGQGTFAETQTFEIPSAGPGTGGTANSPTGSAIPDAACAALGLAPGCTSTEVATACSNPANAAICSGLPRKGLRARISTRAGNASTMTLQLKKGNGTARILTPAPPAGKRGAAAKVKAKSKVKMAATAGAQCTVKASTGEIVGTKTASGKFGTISITPKPGSYTGAKWIKATCTKNGKSFTSNKVRISLK